MKLETGLRPNRAGIPYTLLLRIEAIGFPTFWLLLRCPARLAVAEPYTHPRPKSPKPKKNPNPQTPKPQFLLPGIPPETMPRSPKARKAKKRADIGGGGIVRILGPNISSI